MQSERVCRSQHSPPKNPLYSSSVKGTLMDSFLTEEFETVDVEMVEPSEDNIINILIIGETGVGKSTFINAFANYLRFDNLDQVENENPLVLIPCKFTVTDENYELREISIGSDSNEHNNLGESSTQDPKNYTFPISGGEKFIQLIDTPGIGDTRGINQDTINCQKIIDYIAPLKMIHGIMFLMKPNSSKITVLFEFCMKQILSRLEKSAINNFLFVFTNTRGTCYRPGETLPCLRRVLEDISKKPPYVSIPLSKANIFCLDNEAFRYLAAIGSGIGFTERERQYFVESWDKSAEESWRMIIHIIGDDVKKPLEPHKVADTMCVNEARGLINQLKQPMADITQLIQDKLRVLQKHTEILHLNDLDIDDLKKNLVVPIIDIEAAELPQPVTVCTSAKCAQIYKVRNVKKWHYGQRCHNPCYLKNVPREMIGAPELVYCAAMNSNKKCKECSCDFSTHMHIYYESKTVDKTIENDHVKQSLLSKEELKKEKQRVIDEMNQMKDELENEHKAIIIYIAKFANFLQQNAITPYNDVYRQYIEYLIDLEKSNGEAVDKTHIAYLRKCQHEYDEAKKVFDNVLNMKNQTCVMITPESIKESVDELFKLKHTGKKIQELYKSQFTALNSEKINNYQKFPVKKNHTKEGIISHYGRRLKNYFVGGPQTSTDSEEDNSNNLNKKKANQRVSRKGKHAECEEGNSDNFEKKKTNQRGGKKGKQNGKQYEKQLNVMQQDASAALAALTYDIKNL